MDKCISLVQLFLEISFGTKPSLHIVEKFRSAARMLKFHFQLCRYGCLKYFRKGGLCVGLFIPSLDNSSFDNNFVRELPTLVMKDPAQRSRFFCIQNLLFEKILLVLKHIIFRMFDKKISFTIFLHTIIR